MVEIRNYSNQKRQPNFFSQFVENIKQEMAKSKEMKENLRKFREEAEKLEQSDALKKARAKYLSVEGEASLLKAKLGKVKDTVTGVIEEAGKSDIAKKAGTYCKNSTLVSLRELESYFILFYCSNLLLVLLIPIKLANIYL